MARVQPGNSVDKITHDSRNYLHWAAFRGNTEIVSYLLGKGAKVSAEDSHGTIPLNVAAGAGVPDTQVYDLLIKGGANLKKDVNHDGANALLLAVANDKELKLTDYFVSKGLDLKSTDAAGSNAFGYAARAGNIDVLKALQQPAVVTSGSYEKFVVFNGRRYAHIINPRTGYPATGVSSVTVFGPSTETANGFSTSMMVLGKDAGLKLIRQHPDYQYILVTDAGEIVSSPGLKLKQRSL